MVLHVKWMGVDFGQCLMDSTPERTYWMIGDTSKELGEPELIDIRCERWRAMKEKYGSWAKIKEGYRDKIASYVFDGRPKAGEIFKRVEQKYLKLADGAEDALKYLKSEGIALSMVAEMKRTLGPIGTDLVSNFLKNQGIIQYFDELICPQGRVDFRDKTFDERYKGTSKEEGTLYDVLKEDLESRGYKISECVMMGDKEWSDLTPAQKRGLKAIHYAGFIFHAPSKADHTIYHFSELKDIVKGVK
jgi:FMN phosphatase YigB (HAD superfamily)